MALKQQQGFTLPELLVAGALFGVLAVVAVIFIRPVDYEAARRDAERQAQAAHLAHAIKSYAIDNGKLPEGVTSELTLIGRDEGMLDLCPALEPKYSRDLPVDPAAHIDGASCENKDEPFITGYAVQVTGNRQFEVIAPLVEGSSDISIRAEY